MKSLRSSVAIVSFVLVVSALCLVGCDQVSTPVGSSHKSLQYSYTGAQSMNAPQYPVHNSEGYYDWPDVEYLDRESEIIEALDTFSVSSFAQIASDNAEENTCYSPVSLFYALSMAAYGANGNTRDELFQALSIDDDPELIEQYRSLYLMMYTQEMADQKLANSIWVSNEDLGFNKDYLTLMQDKMFAEVYGVDFGTDKANAAMSAWVADHTQNVVSPELTSDERWAMALMNTVFFKGSWSEEFDASLTHSADFTLQDGSVVTTDFMVLDSGEEHDVITTDDFCATSLYFSNGAMMRLVLPQDGVSVSDIINDGDMLHEALYGEATSQATLTCTMPRVDFGQSHDLIDAARALGVHDAFDNSADFSLMIDAPTSISSIQQDTHLTVDEQGVMGAAFSVVEMMVMSAMPDEIPDEHIDFTLDKPYIYAVISPEGATLFVGAIYNPED